MNLAIRDLAFVLVDCTSVACPVFLFQSSSKAKVRSPLGLQMCLFQLQPWDVMVLNRDAWIISLGPPPTAQHRALTGGI